MREVGIYRDKPSVPRAIVHAADRVDDAVGGNRRGHIDARARNSARKHGAWHCRRAWRPGKLSVGEAPYTGRWGIWNKRRVAHDSETVIWLDSYQPTSDGCSDPRERINLRRVDPNYVVIDIPAPVGA